jgi:putative ABC transport system ATP-binding protein
MTPVLDIAGLEVVAGSDRDAELRLQIPLLQMHAGRCLAITGTTGSGKSTFLEVLALLRRPSRSERFVFRPDTDQVAIALDHVTDTALLRRAPIGYVPQTGGLLPFLSAKDYIEAPLHLNGMETHSTLKARLKRLTGLLGLEEHLSKRRPELSGGQRKRVSLLAGLSVPRVLLIADEPTAGLDAQTGRAVLDCLIGLSRDEATAVVIATHDVTAAADAGFKIVEIAGQHLPPSVLGGQGAGYA